MCLLALYQRSERQKSCGQSELMGIAVRWDRIHGVYPPDRRWLKIACAADRRIRICVLPKNARGQNRKRDQRGEYLSVLYALCVGRVGARWCIDCKNMGRLRIDRGGIRWGGGLKMRG